MYIVQVDNIRSEAENEILYKLAGRDNDGGGYFVPTGARDACWNYKKLDRAIEVFAKFCKVRNTEWQIQLIRDIT